MAIFRLFYIQDVSNYYLLQLLLIEEIAAKLCFVSFLLLGYALVILFKKYIFDILSLPTKMFYILFSRQNIHKFYSFKTIYLKTQNKNLNQFLNWLG